MVKVKVINGLSGETPEKILVKEGNGGVSRNVATIDGGKYYTLEVNENATFREFIFLESKSGLTVTLSSDDFLEYGEFKIEYSGDKLLTYSKSKPRTRESKDKTKDEGDSSSANDASSPWWTKLTNAWNRVRGKKDQPKHDIANEEVVKAKNAAETADSEATKAKNSSGVADTAAQAAVAAAKTAENAAEIAVEAADKAKAKETEAGTP